EGKTLSVPILRPVLDQSVLLTPAGPQVQDPPAGAPPPRLRPEAVANLDWHNDVSRLFLDLNEALTGATDEKTRAVLIRRLRAALQAWQDDHPA
ncbi:MAG: hypothetical protein KDK09_01655, partial [Rhodobacteraceae bacterium]|nr:hypothetical protein [Paracoccaceae bacterium]